MSEETTEQPIDETSMESASTESTHPAAADQFADLVDDGESETAMGEQETDGPASGSVVEASSPGEDAADETETDQAPEKPAPEAEASDVSDGDDFDDDDMPEDDEPSPGAPAVSEPVAVEQIRELKELKGDQLHNICSRVKGAFAAEGQLKRTARRDTSLEQIISCVLELLFEAEALKVLMARLRARSPEERELLYKRIRQIFERPSEGELSTLETALLVIEPVLAEIGTESE